MGVSVRQKDGNWYVFIRHRGERAVQKCVDQQHAEDTQKAVLTAIAAGQFDVSAIQKRGADSKQQNPPVPRLKEYYEKTFVPVYLESAVAESTAASYRNNFKTHINDALGMLCLDEISHDKMEEFVSDLVKKKLAKATIQTIIKDLCTVFNHAK